MNDLVDLPHISSVVAGKPARSDRQAVVIDPASGSATARLLCADQSIVEAAVSAASDAFESWKEVAPAQRARLL